MKCPSPISIPDPNARHKSTRLTVPCGKCGACRYNRRADWSFRLAQELRVADYAQFITLTYDDEHVPFNQSTGELSLDKTHLQLFIKRLRKFQDGNSKSKIRYYAVGEYGSQTDRPHYHAILYNAVPDTIAHLDRTWTYGHYSVDNLNSARIHYVTKYHVNAVKNEDGRTPEFALMSRNPGIGLNYVTSTKDYHLKNNKFSVINNGYDQRMPRYYVDKIFSDLQRKLHAEKVQIEMDTKTNKDYEILQKRGYKTPWTNQQRLAYQKAKRIKDKSKEQDKI